jgi:hypothetical protein
VSTVRDQIVWTAEGQVLENEQLIVDGKVVRNRGDDYWPYVLPGNWVGPYPKHWCGAFALWVLNTVLQTGWLWGFGTRTSGFCWRLRRTSHPQLGDVAYRERPYQHHALVTSIDDRQLVTVDGNSGFPPTVRHGGHLLGMPGWAYFSIDRMIEAAEGRR